MGKRIVIQFTQKQNPYSHWEYLNRENGDRLRISPEKGGLITEWRCEGKEVLYLDKDRFLKKDKSVRGGIPILFPICGDLPQNCLLFSEAKHQLKQHGFARDMSWEINLLEDKSGVALELLDTQETRASFPYKFKIYMEARLKKTSLEIDINIKNRSDILMPFSFGLHPYFNISDFNNIEIKGLHSKCINQINMLEETVEDQIQRLDKGVDFLSGPSKSVRIIDSSAERCIELEQNSPMDLTVVWTDPPRRMICVEPWTSPRQSLLSGERKIQIGSGSSYALRTIISCKDLDSNST